MIGQSIITAAIAGASVAAVTPAVKKIAVLTRAVAQPKQDRWHTRPIPLLGGVAIAVGIAVALAANGAPSRSILPAYIVITGMFLLGLVDDLVKLKPVSKLVGQIVVACVFPLLGGGPGWTGVGVLNGVLEIAWIVTITNAVNLLDNMDGLCAGIAAIASIGCWLEFAACEAAG